jgi:hypothetical protein
MKYPIYIPSKGRADSRLTVKTLEELNISYRIVVEPQEYDDYAAVINPKNILLLPFSNLGLGSIPARNWIWEHSLSEGHEKHWILDDNISNFFRYNRNRRVRVSGAAGRSIFTCCEDFTDRFENVKLSGMNYRFFVPDYSNKPPYQLNTRIYSCILIDNSLPFRWRGKYNEDTDLSLRALKAGYCTILFNAFLCGKAATLTMKGGNTDNVYVDGDKRLKFAQSLYEQHPDVTQVVWRHNRWHHHVDYSVFKQKLKRKKNIQINNNIDDYGMVLMRRNDKMEYEKYEES